MPRFQLLVLMLALVTGLFPERSMADGNSGPSSNANGRVTRRAIECYHQELCTSNDCLKADKTKRITCPEGYCGVKIEEKDSKISVTRGCAPIAEGDCYILQFGRGGGCLINDKTSSDRQTFLGQYTNISNCMKKGTKGHPLENNSNGMSCKRRQVGEDIVDKVATCICTKAFCNGRTSVGPPERRHIGYSLAFLGALLAVLYHLQTMFVVE